MSKLPPEIQAELKRLQKIAQEQREHAERAALPVAKSLVEKLGDKMATAKRPFWRKLVGFFR